MLKILYLSLITPDTSCGAHIAIYRHLIYKQDFEVAVCSTVADASLTKDKFVITRNSVFERLRKTRLSRLVFNYDYVMNWYSIPQEVLNYAKDYQPDIILTVADNIHGGFALQLSEKLKIPLVVNFQDLSPLSQFISVNMAPFTWVRKFLMNKFHDLHNNADLVFYTSEGMKKWFESHKNGHILYPLGDFERPTIAKDNENTHASRPVTVVYAGNCYGAYGRMLLKFARQVKGSNEIHLKIFPVGKGWTDEEINEMREAGIYQSFMPFEQLRQELQKADAFLTVMSFEEPERPFVQTSFTTKWLDYAPYGKPIFVWAPSYSSASIFARKYGCGVVTDSDDPTVLKDNILHCSNSEPDWTFFGEKARYVSDQILNPEKIHQLFVNEIRALAEKNFAQYSSKNNT